MPFTITITETRTIETVTARTWQKGGPDGTNGREYGYTLQIPETRSETIERLKQTVETLDLPAVIKAINGLQ